MSLEEKVRELYGTLKQKCSENSLCLAWEIHKELRKFRKENPEIDEEWSIEAMKV